MTRRLDRSAAAALALLACAPAAAAVLTGEVRSLGAQPIYTPQSNTAPVTIRYFVPEGQAVKAGEVVLRIDPGQAGTQIPELDAKLEQTRAKAAKETAELEVKTVDAEVALADAEAALATARIEAAIPRGLISQLDYDRHQGDLDKTTRELKLKREQLAAAHSAQARQREDARLEVAKLSGQRDYYALLLRQSEVRAERDGIVLHGFNTNWIGGRIDEGSSTMPGSKAGEIAGDGGMQVRAWALEPDRRGLRVGQPVQLAFDALPRQRLRGRITAIAGAPDRKPEWGEGRYFSVDIALPPRHALKLLPGMSVRVSPLAPAGAAR
ncbi:HlyD family efflux transporter periplasmic adaptor subunit [Lysobacter sp. BMK333-48F3]|uniref:HlyD family secretion protein n=1 Tax=Lysobacter sp. BMK333-48F3 TaxID=2867962 RepID=UPI001C8CA4E9|nr:HlyD family efflux transporter periplasmic adaptor subunit [Lysobacter sp. BMK333-48F3]MBX9401156.1 HlyD family efflux transporter periplasmic adaptor subunit [Lysobacter sp. BMK333-48F3]